MFRLNERVWNHSDTRKFLCRNNSRYCGQQFVKFISEMAAEDHALRAKRVDEDTILITGAHTSLRINGRTGMEREHVEARLVELLRDDVLMEAIRRYPIYWDDETQKVAAMDVILDEDGVKTEAIATAIVDESKQLVYVIEVGWDYAYCLTVLDYGHYYGCGNVDGKVLIHRDTAVITVRPSGMLLIDQGNEFVCRETREQEKSRLERA